MGDTGAPHLQRFGLQTLHKLRDRYGWCPRPTRPAAGPDQVQRLVQGPAGCNLTREDANAPLKGRPAQCLTGLRCYVAVPSPRDRAVQPVKA